MFVEHIPRGIVLNILLVSTTQPIKQSRKIGNSYRQKDGIIKVIDDITGSQTDTHSVLDKIDMHIHAEARLVRVFRLGPVMIDGRCDTPPREKSSFIDPRQIQTQDPEILASSVRYWGESGSMGSNRIPYTSTALP